MTNGHVVGHMTIGHKSLGHNFSHMTDHKF